MTDFYINNKLFRYSSVYELINDKNFNNEYSLFLRKIKNSNNLYVIKIEDSREISYYIANGYFHQYLWYNLSINAEQRIHYNKVQKKYYIELISDDFKHEYIINVLNKVCTFICIRHCINFFNFKFNFNIN